MLHWWAKQKEYLLQQLKQHNPTTRSARNNTASDWEESFDDNIDNILISLRSNDYYRANRT